MDLHTHANIHQPLSRKQYTSEQGQLREIKPHPNSFFDNPSNNRSIAPQKRQKMKQAYCESFNINPSSKIFNYYFKDILLLQKIYEGYLNSDVLRQINSSRKSLQMRLTLAKQAFFGYAVYLLTFGRNVKWVKLTSTRMKYFILFYSGSLVMTTPYVMQANEVLNTMRFHHQYQKILDLYEKEAFLN